MCNSEHNLTCVHHHALAVPDKGIAAFKHYLLHFPRKHVSGHVANMRVPRRGTSILWWLSVGDFEPKLQGKLFGNLKARRFRRCSHLWQPTSTRLP